MHVTSIVIIICMYRMYLAYRNYQCPVFTASDLLDNLIYCYLKNKLCCFLPGSNKKSSASISKGIDYITQKTPLRVAAN